MTSPSIGSETQPGPAGTSLRGEVERAWHRVRARADREGRSGVLALRLRVPDVDPLRFFLAARDHDRFFWSRPDAGVQRACAGVAWSLPQAAPTRDSRASRFAGPARAVADLLERVEVVGDPAPDEAGPVLHAGFSFEAREARQAAEVRPSRDVGQSSIGAGASPGGEDLWAAFPDTLIVLAERQVVRIGASCFVTRALLVEPGAEPEGWTTLFESVVDEAAEAAEEEKEEPAHDFRDDVGPEYTVRADRPHARYQAGVREALHEIERGGLDKVVLARALDVHHPGRFALGDFIARLAETYPTCATLAVARGSDAFVAASPERLLQLEGGLARTAALAGTAQRGRTPEADEALGHELLACPKNRAEHAAVVESIVDVLGRYGRVECAGGSPRLLKLEGIQHLETPIELKLDADADPGRPGEAILNLVGQLHPTPAVGGRPARRAGEWIARHEALDRGWYAAPVGLITLQGDGEFRVALRSGLLRETEEDGAPFAHARLFAGAGIVAGSDPRAELLETRVKLRALLAPLTEI